MKKLDRNIQDKHGFQILVIIEKQVLEQADYTFKRPRVKVGNNVMIYKHIIFYEKKYLLYYWCSRLCHDSSPADNYLLALLCT